MATDAKFDKIQKIVQHDNADSLEIAIVSNFPCVVRKGEFKEGDWCFYIRDDAKLIGYDELKAREERDREAAKTGDFVTQDGFSCSFLWHENLLKYLGSGGRVKTIKLRGKTSMGILLKPETVLEMYGRLVLPSSSSQTREYPDSMIEMFNHKISDPEKGAKFLEDTFGVKHWEMPLYGSMGVMNARGPLIYGLWKTDEENFQNIEDCLFPWNDKVLITRKMDGSSCSISSTPDGDVHVMSRSLDLRLDDDNIWTRASKNVIPLVKKLAKYYNDTIVVRGEVTGIGINTSKVNIDCVGDATFNMFAVAFPNATDESKRIGLFGTEWHFLEVNKVCKSIAGEEIKTVPIEGVETLTRELLENISDRPCAEGEGRVINTRSLILPHFKSKSKEYLLHLG